MQELKVTAVVLGASGVGKTSLCRQLTDQGFSESYVPTKGCDSYVIRRELIKEGVFVLKLWDLSGDENFDRIAPTFIQTTNTFFLVWDASNPESMKRFEDYLSMIRQSTKPDPRIIFVRNKTDLAQGPMTEQESNKIKELMENREIKYAVVETSAKTSKNLFETFLDKIGQFLGKDLRLKINKLRDRFAKVSVRVSPPANPNPNPNQSEYKSHIFWRSREVRRQNLKPNEDQNWLWLNLESIRHKKSSTAKWLQEQTQSNLDHIRPDDSARSKTAFELLKYLDEEERRFAPKIVGAAYSILHLDRSKKYLEDRKIIRELVYKMAKDIYDSGLVPSAETYNKFPKRFKNIKTDVGTIVKTHLSGDNRRNSFDRIV